MPRPARDVLTTPDGRYIVVRGRLWRASNPHLLPAEREGLVQRLMSARRALRCVEKNQNRSEARSQVEEMKRALGERGPVWWTDGAPDDNRRLVRNTQYADWFAGLQCAET